MRNQWRNGAAVIALALAAGTPLSTSAWAASDAEIQQLRAQIEAMAKQLETLEAKQAKTEEKVDDTRDRAVLSTGKSPGSFIIPGTQTEVEISGYLKADLLFDNDESTGDLFVPEAITTTGNDEQRFRAHARQSRLRIKTSSPTDWGDLSTTLEGDFFGNGGNEVFSNSHSFRLRHAYASVGGITAGQTWTNFMPIESYPTTLDFNGPAGIPFIRQAQIRYTTDVSDGLSFSTSLENSEFSGRNAAGTISESTNLGIRAGVDQAPDVTAAITQKLDGGLVKLAGVGRYLGSPNDAGDSELGWGLNLSGNHSLWEGGKALGSFTYGDGIGRYILNGAGQDGFVNAAGDVDTIEAYGVTVALSQSITDSVDVGLAYGRAEFLDTFAPGDLDNVNTVHASIFWRPIDRWLLGGEVIYGDREDANGASDDALRFQTSVQVNF